MPTLGGSLIVVVVVNSVTLIKTIALSKNSILKTTTGNNIQGMIAEKTILKAATGGGSTV